MIVTLQLKYYPKAMAAGKSEVRIQLQGGETLGDLKRALRETLPELFPEAEYAKYIVNGRLAGNDTVLMDGNNVNILLPVFGG